jgi:molybdate transport system regulatory protein
MTGLGPNPSERRPPIGFATTAVASWLRRKIATSAAAFGLGKAGSARMIAETGLIAAAGRAVRVSYKRAWQLLDAMNRCFREPLVKSNKDGRSSGGAYLTSTGVEVLACYRALAERAGRGLCRRSLCTRPHRAVAFSAQ